MDADLRFLRTVLLLKTILFLSRKELQVLQSERNVVFSCFQVVAALCTGLAVLSLLDLPRYLMPAPAEGTNPS
jgi:hypothetical protein